MKFLCENCKAKYQIADEKVAGRTVRMKCRKCGHLIEVEASVTETSVAAKMPQETGPGAGASTGISASHGAVRAAAAGLPPPRPPAFPEPVAMLKESAGPTRASLTPAPPHAGGHPSNRPAPPGARAGSLGLGPRPGNAPRTAAVAAAARSNVVALASRRATAEKIEGLGEPDFDDDIKIDTEIPAHDAA